MQEVTLTQDPLAQLTEAGDGVDYCWLKIGSRPTLFVNRPDLIQWLFTSPQVGRGRFVRLFSRFLGDGLLTSDGDAHDEMRRRMQAAFTHEAQTLYLDRMARYAASLLQGWETGKAFDLGRALRELSIRAGFMGMFGLERVSDADEDEALAVMHDVSAMLVGQSAGVPAGHYRKQGRVRHPAVDEMLGYVFHHWQPSPMVDLLSAMDAQSRYDHTFTLMNAGVETGYSALIWTMFLLSRNPLALASVRDEIRAVDAITPESAHRMRQLMLAVHEALRLYPVAGWLNTRETLSDARVGELELEAGTPLFASSWVTHRDGRYHADPLAFIPERFEQRPNPWVYFPFGGGTHTCIGRSLALSQTVLLVAMLLRRFDFDFAPENALTPALTMALIPQGQFIATVW
jgi:cytochrome P450